MTSAFPLHRYTYQDYVWLEEESSTRHEFLAGEIVAIAGGTPEHGVRVLQTGLATYPDATVVCGPTVRDPDKKTNVTNPRVLVEVTSDGTEDYDRGEKLTHYQQIPSLEAVVIVSHREPRIEVWSRSPDSTSWERSEAGAGGEVSLSDLGCKLSVDAVWQAALEP